MGKKSVVDAPLLPSSESRSVDTLEMSLPAEQNALAELFQEFLRMAFQAQIAEETQESRSKSLVSATFPCTFISKTCNHFWINKLCSIPGVGLADEDFTKLFAKQKMMRGGQSLKAWTRLYSGVREESKSVQSCLFLLSIAYFNSHYWLMYQLQYLYLS